MTQAGPFGQWPTGRGFNRYYGFLGGEDDQWAPELWYDNHHVPVPDRDGYHLSEDLVDKSIEFLSNHLSAAPERPYYLHLAFGAGHAPHQAPPEFIDRYRDRFGHGWDVERQRTLELQKLAGIVPAETELPPSNPGVPAWADLTPDEARLCARMQEVFAGFLEHTDAQIGRLLEFLHITGQIDNTMVILMSDNGASGEGGDHGLVNEYTYFLGLEESLEEKLANIDRLGSAWTHNHYPAGWAQAGNTPLKYYKRYAFGGGVRAPLVISYPAAVRDPGALRSEFHHVIDIVPTVLETVGVAAPTQYQGRPQMPLHGRSLAYTLFKEGGGAERTVQYFETGGFRGLYQDGWKVVTNHQQGASFDDDEWELYYLPNDFAETKNLARDHPEKVQELTAEWLRQAKEFGVLPLDDRGGERVISRDPATERRTLKLLRGTRLPNGTAGPSLGGRPFAITARIDRASCKDEGVILAYGRRAAGFSFFIKDNELHFDLNLAGAHYVVCSEPLEPGSKVVQASLSLDGPSPTMELRDEGRVVGSLKVPSAMPVGFGTMSTQVGYNSPSPVSLHYEAPFAFSGRLDHVTLTLGDQSQSARDDLWKSAMSTQ
jgi:arylsulfatase